MGQCLWPPSNLATAPSIPQPAINAGPAPASPASVSMASRRPEVVEKATSLWRAVRTGGNVRL